MDLQLLRVFQYQVLFQCKVGVHAASDLEAALSRETPRASDLTSRVFASIQNLLTASANVSKALWGQGGARTQQRELLRRTLDVSDSSPLRDVLMRNHFEHFDERLDQWWAKSPERNIVDLGVGPPEAMQSIDGTQLNVFRVYDPMSGDLWFWGDNFNVRELAEELRRLLPIASKAVVTPYWEDPEWDGPRPSWEGGGQ